MIKYTKAWLDALRHKVKRRDFKRNSRYDTFPRAMTEAEKKRLREILKKRESQ